MKSRLLPIFKHSYIAAAILSLSACTITPNTGLDIGSIANTVGNGLEKGLDKVGDTTAVYGSKAWEGTKRLLYIGPYEEDQLLDEVDLALMEDDAEIELAPVQVAVVSAEETFQAVEPALDTNGLPSNTVAAVASTGDLSDIIVDQTGSDPTSGNVVSTQNWTHLVKVDETLWDIAKATTGDANNWHIIADLNDLAPDASVYPGMKLDIPADMVKPDIAFNTESKTEDNADITNPELAAANSSTIQSQLSAADQLLVTKPVTSKPDTLEQSAEPVVAAVAQKKTEQQLSEIASEATAMKVAEGETLWNFTKRTTGDATNWKILAEKNQFSASEATRVIPGQTIYVPNAMIVERDANGQLISNANINGDQIPTATAGNISASDSNAVNATTAVLTGTNQPDQNSDIKIVEAAYQDETLKPVTDEQLSAEANATLEENDNNFKSEVMVSGTYYPKAVYLQADLASSLLMRVSPGTPLQVSKKIGPWLEVQTNQGIGYVHSRDVK